MEETEKGVPAPANEPDIQQESTSQPKRGRRKGRVVINEPIELSSADTGSFDEQSTDKAVIGHIVKKEEKDVDPNVAITGQDNSKRDPNIIVAESLYGRRTRRTR